MRSRECSLPIKLQLLPDIFIQVFVQTCIEILIDKRIIINTFNLRESKNNKNFKN